MVRKNKVSVNRLYYFADKYRKLATSEDDIFRIDMTDEFFGEIRRRIKEKDIILINVNGRVRSGKSTCGMAIGKYVLDAVNEFFPKSCIHKKFSMKNVARDQMEKSMMMKNDEYNYTVIVTDEVNESEKTGANATTERAIQVDQSNVQAARYIHGVYCNPNEAIDPNVDILLNVISKDTKKKMLRCKLFYKYNEGLIEYSPQILGYVDIYVGDLIKEWLVVEKSFIKKKKTAADRKLIKETAQKDFYVKYMILKHLKIELAARHNIARTRDLNYVKVTLDVLEEMKPLTKIQIKGVNLLDKSSIKLTVKKHQRKRKINASLIGEMMALDDVFPILEAYKGLYVIENEIMALEKSKAKGIVSDYKDQMAGLDLARQLTKNRIKDNLEELHNYIKLDNEYNKHLQEMDIKER